MKSSFKRETQMALVGHSRIAASTGSGLEKNPGGRRHQSGAAIAPADDFFWKSVNTAPHCSNTVLLDFC